MTFFSLSLSHTHTDTDTNIDTHTNTHTHTCYTHTLSLCLFPSAHFLFLSPKAISAFAAHVASKTQPFTMPLAKSLSQSLSVSLLSLSRTFSLFHHFQRLPLSCKLCHLSQAHKQRSFVLLLSPPHTHTHTHTHTHAHTHSHTHTHALSHTRTRASKTVQSRDIRFHQIAPFLSFTKRATLLYTLE